MKSRSRLCLAGATALGLTGAALWVSGPAGAAPAAGSAAARTVYVAASGTTHASYAGSSCTHPNYTAIQDAIEAVPAGGTVIVCPGTYPGMVNVDRAVTLSGRPGATIDATNDIYGIGVSASWATVTGMTVTGASPYNPDTNQIADGIITAAFGPDGPVAADHVTITHNTVRGNLGSGIDLNSTSYSTAAFNVADGNGVGINVSNDLGLPANNNTVFANVTDDNFGGCGIALADHTGAGVRNTLVKANTSNDNGLASSTAPDASAGSGVILASPAPGGIVTGNKIIGNSFNGNGHGGVVMHAHAPGADFSGNAVLNNQIGTNNLRTDENDTQTTGVYLGSFSPQSIAVSGNLIGPDVYGIFTSGPVTVTGGSNSYVGVTTKLGSAPTF